MNIHVIKPGIYKKISLIYRKFKIIGNFLRVMIYSISKNGFKIISFLNIKYLITVPIKYLCKHLFMLNVWNH